MRLVGIGRLEAHGTLMCVLEELVGLYVDLHSGPTPRGKLPAAATRELARVLRSTTRPC